MNKHNIPSNLEYLSTENGYEFYCLNEHGFTHKSLGLDYQLYEDFGPNYDSTYYNMFKGREYTTEYLSQIWVFKDEHPVGLGVAVHFQEPYEKIIHQKTGFISQLAGHIHLFVAPAHRGQGLASTMFPLLEKSLAQEKKFDYPPSVTLQDRAFAFSSLLKHFWAVPFSPDCRERKDNIHYVFSYYKHAFENMDKLECLQNTYPKIHDIIKNAQAVHLQHTPKLTFKVSFS